ncbi:MAG: phytanoyl-CoA dioxygenase family protein [Gammaproteobacteria bacterium]|nr:phytanoyl-CoA dioxygenase family protein [Gammaproteobacteria bacterium]
MSSPRSHHDPRFQPAARLAELAKKQADASFVTEREKMEAEPASIGLPIELQAGECMFHHCLNFHATPHNTTDRQRRALVLIHMHDEVTFFLTSRRIMSWCRTITVAPGERMDGDGFRRWPEQVRVGRARTWRRGLPMRSTDLSLFAATSWVPWASDGGGRVWAGDLPHRHQRADHSRSASGATANLSVAELAKGSRGDGIGRDRPGRAGGLGRH